MSIIRMFLCRFSRIKLNDTGKKKTKPKKQVAKHTINLFIYHSTRCSSILGWRFGQYHLEEFKFLWEE